MASITAIILTLNEEKNIVDCIESIKDICDRIVVVDSYSTDKTKEICLSYGCDFYEHKFVNHADQFNYALKVADINTTWVFLIFSDERLTKDSSKEIVRLCEKNLTTSVNGIILKFKFYFLGKYLKHGGYYPIWKLCIFKFGKGHIEQKEMDEHIVLDEGNSIKCKKDSLHHDCKTINDWITKHNNYSNKELLDYLNIEIASSDTKSLDSSSKAKRRIKNGFYYKLPLGLRAHLLYIYRYYFRLGFLDGRPGKYYAFLQSYWYRYLIDIKIYEHFKTKK